MNHFLTTMSSALKDYKVFCDDWNKPQQSWRNMMLLFVTNSTRELWRGLIGLLTCQKRFIVTSPCSDPSGQGDNKSESRIWCLCTIKWAIVEWLSLCWSKIQSENSQDFTKVLIVSNSMDCRHREGFSHDFNGPKYCDVWKFLWINDTESQDPEVVCLRFTRVVFGVSSSPFLLNATLKHHVEEYSSSYPEVIKTLT